MCLSLNDGPYSGKCVKFHLNIVFSEHVPAKIKFCQHIARIMHTFRLEEFKGIVAQSAEGQHLKNREIFIT